MHSLCHLIPVYQSNVIFDISPPDTLYFCHAELCSYCAVNLQTLLTGCPFYLSSHKLPIICMGNISSPFKNFLKLSLMF